MPSSRHLCPCQYPYAASHVSLSTLNSFSWTAARYSIAVSWFCRDRNDWYHGKEGVENDADDGLGQGIEAGYSSRTVYVSGIFQLKRWEGVHSSWRHHFQRSFGRFSSPFPNANLPLYGTRAYIFLFGLSNSSSSNSLLTPLLVELDAVVGGPTVCVEKLQIVDTRKILWQGLVYGARYFSWYLRYGGPLEEDVSSRVA